MFSIGDIACIFGMNENTIRYWLKKNKNDYESHFYNFNLTDLMFKVETQNKIQTKYNTRRKYTKYIILDVGEFKYEFFKYVDFIKSIRKKKRAGTMSWTLSAIECYNNQMDCNKCFNKEICTSAIDENKVEPPMKDVVKKLLAEIGKPPNPYFLD